MTTETFKGVERRFLIPIEQESKDGDGEGAGIGDPDNPTGFDDSQSTSDGLGGMAEGEGGVAKGKSTFELPEDFEERKKKLQEKLAREVASMKVCEKIGVVKDCVKELVKEAYLKSRELARLSATEEYTIMPLVDQKPKDTEYEVVPGTMPEYIHLENSVRKEIHVISKHLRDIVIDELAPRWIPGADKGKRIDRRLIARVPMGERKFFKYKIETNILNMAAFLLVDESGSMYGDKCITKDTWLLTSKGLQRFEEIFPSSLPSQGCFKKYNEKVYGPTGLVKASHFFYAGRSPTKKITTRFGFWLEGTPDHPIWVMNKMGNMTWKKMGDISTEDYIAIQRGQECFGEDADLSGFSYARKKKDFSSIDCQIPPKMTPTLGRLLGYLVAEGTTTNTHYISFAQEDKEIVEDYKSLVKNLFGLETSTPSSEGNDREVNHDTHSIKMRKFLEFCGIDYVYAKDKQVPWSVRQSSKKVVVEFLRGFFEGDGGNNNCNKHNPRAVIASSASLGLLQQIQLLLLNMDIVSTIQKQWREKYQRYYYLLCIYGKGFEKYAKEIGFISSRKKKELQQQIDRKKKTKTTTDIIPFVRIKLYNLLTEYRRRGYTWPRLVYRKNGPEVYYTKSYHPNNLTYDKLECILGKYACLSDFQDYKDLQNIQQAHYFWDKVVEIEESQNETYDLTIPQGHAFFSNGFISHNCHQARRCAIMFGKILDSIGIPCMIAGFTTTDLTSEQAAKAKREGNSGKVYSRVENLRHNIYKRFEEPYNRVKTKLVKISAFANNFDACSLEWSWGHLQQYCLSHNIERKLLIMVGDAQVCGGVGAREKLIRVINEIGCDLDASCIGVGISTHYMTDFFNECIEIEDVAQLGMNVVRLLKSAIKNGMRKW
jgi:intein/homing endonuclease